MRLFLYYELGAKYSKLFYHWLYRSRAKRHFYGIEIEIWAGFGLIGRSEKKIGTSMGNFKIRSKQDCKVFQPSRPRKICINPFWFLSVFNDVKNYWIILISLTWKKEEKIISKGNLKVRLWKAFLSYLPWDFFFF